MLIENRRQLLSHGSVDTRKACLDIIEHSLRSVDVGLATRSLLKIKNDYLVSKNKSILDLSKCEKIYVIGGGKGAYGIASALEEILQERIDGGLISIKKGEKRKKLRRIRIIESGHPVPDAESLKAGQEIVKLADAATEKDLFFCAITGGASSLIALPPDSVSFVDNARLHDLLVRSGAPVNEINCVRNHVSKIKGGLLARRILPARIINLIAVDEIEGVYWGPTAPDRTTFAEAISILKRRNLWDRVPRSVRTYLKGGLTNPKLETVKDSELKNAGIHTLIVADNKTMLSAARDKAARLGLRPFVLTSRLEGESREAGTVFGSIAAHFAEYGEAIKPPCALIAGGETTVRIEDSTEGLGGPSQEFALGAAMKIAGNKGIAVASIDTDGTDGPTEAAGGLVDGYTLYRSAKRERDSDVYTALENHSSFYFLSGLGDAIKVSATNTNVMDLDIAVILGSRPLKRS